MCKTCIVPYSFCFSLESKFFTCLFIVFLLFLPIALCYALTSLHHTVKFFLTFSLFTCLLTNLDAKRLESHAIAFSRAGIYKPCFEHANQHFHANQPETLVSIANLAQRHRYQFLKELRFGRLILVRKRWEW
jgi:hypothetical protein